MLDLEEGFREQIAVTCSMVMPSCSGCCNLHPLAQDSITPVFLLKAASCPERLAKVTIDSAVCSENQDLCCCLPSSRETVKQRLQMGDVITLPAPPEVDVTRLNLWRFHVEPEQPLLCFSLPKSPSDSF
jgi:hypothetical protein